MANPTASIPPRFMTCPARVNPLIRKESREGIGYSVVEINDVRHIFAAAVPGNGGNLYTQTHDALQTVARVFREEGSRGSIVHQAVFMRDIALVEQCRQIMRDFYGLEMPATSYIPQAPCGGKLVEIEALGVGRHNDDVQIERYGEQLVVTRHGGVAWAHVADVCPATSAQGTYDRSIDAFRRMENELESLGYHLQQIVRTWLYLGDIVGREADTQRYKELNRARTDFYEGIEFGNGHVCPDIPRPIYPASTGIGTDGHDVRMSCIALATTRNDLKLVPLENPLQTSACDYAASYSPQSPKFARAMAIAAGKCATILVSGTASITASETRYQDDVRLQTEQTLDNIAALISAENLARHGLAGYGATLDDMSLVRVYVKRQEDYDAAKEVCRRRLGELPTIYAIGDVCRPDLLVEIEGIAFACRRG